MIVSSVSLPASLSIGHGKKTVANGSADESPSIAIPADFVEVGVVISKHGVRGEMLVRSSTDFPKARFETPGMRWLKVPHKGKHRLECVELVSGRPRAGKLPCWLVKLKNVTTPEQVACLVGSTMLLKRDEKPALEEGEFYVPDLIGMEVVLKSTGETIGTVDDMFNFGAQDILRVKRIGEGPMIWVPFVEPIVPEVLLEQRKMIITPPQGLLELNIRKPKQANSEARKAEIRARRKLQERVGGLKKSLAKAKQGHLVEKINTRDESMKEQRVALVMELLKIDFKWLLDTFHQAFNRIHSNKCQRLLSGFPEVPLKQMIDQKELEGVETFVSQGLRLIAENSVAVISFGKLETPSLLELQATHVLQVQHRADLEFPDDEVKCQVPWFIVTSSLEAISSVLNEKNFFGLEETQVCLLEQEMLPVFELDKTDGEPRILMQSPWKMAQSPTGDGGVIKLLSSENLVNQFFDNGIEYLQVYDADNDTARIDPLLFGLAHEQQSELGIQLGPPKPGKDIIGFVENEGYDLVKFSGDIASLDQSWLQGATTPSGSYVLSIEFLKRLQDSDFEPQLHMTRTEAGLGLEYMLLDCLNKCKPHKIFFTHNNPGLE